MLRRRVCVRVRTRVRTGLHECERPCARERPCAFERPGACEHARVHVHAFVPLRACARVCARVRVYSAVASDGDTVMRERLNVHSGKCGWMLFSVGRGRMARPRPHGGNRVAQFGCLTLVRRSHCARVRPQRMIPGKGGQCMNEWSWFGGQSTLDFVAQDNLCSSRSGCLSRLESLF